MPQQQNDKDIDEATVHQQEIEDDVIVDVIREQAETTNDSSSVTTTCHRDENTFKRDKKRWGSTQWRNLRSGVARDETVDPRNFPAYKKRLIMIQMMFAAMITPLSTTISLPALPTMQQDLQTSETAINAATTSIFVFFNASVPIIWASYSDVYGRRRIYLISIAIAIIGNACCAVSINIAMLIVFRIMSAVGSCSILTVGTGILSDIYGPGERGKAYSWFVSAPLVVPAVAPVIGGYLTEGLGWRSTFACIAIYAFCTWVVMVFALPESLRRSEIFDLPTRVNEKNETVKDQKVIAKRRFVNPVSALRLVRHLNVILPAFFSGILYFTFFAINTTLTWIYSNQYGFSPGIVGVCYIAGALGGIVGSTIAGLISDRLYAADVAKGLKAYPERRLHYPLFGASIAILVLSTVAYGWCTGMNLHFVIGLIALFFAFASLIVPSIVLTVYLVECYPKHSASAAACNNLIRFCMGGVGALVASDCQQAIGNGPFFSACAGAIFLGSGLIIWTKQGRARWASTRELNNH
ncbi:major facilitator superfamily domain-containing protein [Fennellomyces sp. T-0311]|nr:major facilitator superfamily domain-containing protein [Fennellomyces sp. T-0311]